jgi:indolepyruvate ferredoxin oxidoreductase beta subunit
MTRTERKQSSDVIIAGVGGQGTVLASKLLAHAAMLEGRQVRTAETIGMAQRGGSVLGHVRMSFLGNDASANAERGRNLRHTPTPALSPLVPPGGAELLIGFEPAETVRALEFVRTGGAVVTAKRVIAPVCAALEGQTYDGRAEIDYLISCKANGRISQLILIDGDAACARLGSSKALNVVLLGAALALGIINISEQALEEALGALVKPNFIELNKQALQEGRTWV